MVIRLRPCVPPFYFVAQLVHAPQYGAGVTSQLSAALCTREIGLAVSAGVQHALVRAHHEVSRLDVHLGGVV